MKLQPTGDKVLIRPLKPAVQSSIALPASYQQPEAFGEIVRRGTYMVSTKGIRHQEWPIKEGDKVTFASGAGQGLEIEEDGETLILLHVNQLRTIVESE
jgi:co-chaperonin GroES (HSP10)